MSGGSGRPVKTPGGRKKTTRLEARLSEAQKDLLQRAADIRGQTLSEFVVGASEAAAAGVLRESGILALAARDQAAFVDALLAPSEPSPRLRAAAARYRTTMGPRRRA